MFQTDRFPHQGLLSLFHKLKGCFLFNDYWWFNSIQTIHFKKIQFISRKIYSFGRLPAKSPPYFNLNLVVDLGCQLTLMDVVKFRLTCYSFTLLN